MKGFLKFLILLILFLALVLGGMFLWGTSYLQRWAETPVALSGPAEVKLKRGMRLRTISRALSEEKLVSSPVLFEAYVRFYSSFERFQAGPYRFEESVSPKDIAATMTRGETYQPLVVQITIPEGFTYEQAALRLVAAGVGSDEEFTELFDDTQFMESLGIKGKTLEGYLYPATYPFSEVPTAKNAIRRMVETFFANLPENYETSVEEKGLSLTEAVTFASLIELETKFDDERSKVSEVIWNRLNRKMALGIDAAIIYGISDYKGDLTWKHLKDATNPYNTRIHGGLPPTPIGSPARNSLEAVLTPTDEGYLYYVVDLDQGGRHHFSKSLKEHNKWVRKLVRAKRGK